MLSVSTITLDFEKYIMKRIEQKGIIDKINEEFEKAESQYIKRQKKRLAVNCTDTILANISSSTLLGHLTSC